MKKFGLSLGIALFLAMNAMAGEWSGYISDSSCATKMSASAVASAAHADCAKTCLKNGDSAVLVTPDGKVFKIANTDKVIDYAGMKVTIEGDLDHDAIKVTKVRK